MQGRLGGHESRWVGEGKVAAPAARYYTMAWTSQHGGGVLTMGAHGAGIGGFGEKPPPPNESGGPRHEVVSGGGSSKRDESLFYCATSDVGFATEAELKAHYQGEWHRYNLKRKVAGLPPVTREFFERTVGARGGSGAASAAASLSAQGPRTWYCPLLRKTFASENSYLTATQSKKYQKLLKAQGLATPPEPTVTTAASAPGFASTMKHGGGGAEHKLKKKGRRAEVRAGAEVREGAAHQGARVKRAPPASRADVAVSGTLAPKEEDEDDEDEMMREDVEEGESSGWETASSDGDRFEAMDDDVDLAAYDAWDPCRCLFCNRMSDGIDANVMHMHRGHGFVVPDAEACVDLEGLVRYLGFKVSVAHIPLDRPDSSAKAPLRSLHAVQRHALDSPLGHLLAYDGNEEEYEDYYDYSRLGEAEADAQDGSHLAVVARASEADAQYAEGTPLVRDAMTGVLRPLVSLADDGTDELVRGRDNARLGHRGLRRFYRQNARRAFSGEDQRAGVRLATGEAQQRLVLEYYKAKGVETLSKALLEARKDFDRRYSSVRGGYLAWASESGAGGVKDRAGQGKHSRFDYDMKVANRPEMKLRRHAGRTGCEGVGVATR